LSSLTGRRSGKYTALHVQRCDLISHRRVAYKVDGKPWVDKLRDEDSKDAIVEFKETLSAIGSAQGWKLEDLRARFSNDLFNRLLFGNDTVIGGEKTPTA
jgi:hypothetical protein